jgi:DNA polymerase eta
VNDGNGSIIALSYEARARGVKRGMRGEEARKICPEMQLIQVPTSHQKADLTLYRDEGKRVIDVLLRRVAVVERASIDEAYLDVTAEADKLLREQGLRACCAAAAGTHVGGVEDMPEAKLSQSALRRGHAAGAGEEECTPPEALSAAWLSRPADYWTKEEAALVAGAALAKTLREDVRAQLGHTCSAGVAPNKLLAKLATGLRKPDAQTLLPPASTAALLRHLPLARLRGLGGAFGAQCGQANLFRLFLDKLKISPILYNIVNADYVIFQAALAGLANNVHFLEQVQMCLMQDQSSFEPLHLMLYNTMYYPYNRNKKKFAVLRRQKML